MLKALGNPRAAIKLCRCQHFPFNFTKLSQNRIHYLRQDHFESNIQPKNSTKNVFSVKLLTRSKCSSVSLDDNDGLEEMLFEPNEQVESGLMQIKDFLYNHLSSDDELLIEMNNCSDEDTLIKVLNDNVEKLTRPYAVLFVVKLWHCRAMTKKNEDSGVELLLKNVLHYSSDMNVDELSVCFMYLTKLSVPMQTDVMTTILELILKFVKNGELGDIPLSVLSRFSVAVNINSQLYAPFLFIKILPHIFHHLEQVTTNEELRLLTICLSNIHQLLSSESLELYRRKVVQFIEADKLKDDSRTVLKILQFLCFPYWSQAHLPLIRTLMFQLENKISDFDAKELEFIGTLFQLNFEPARIGTTVAKCASELLEKNPTADALSCTVFHSTPRNRQTLVELAKEFLFSNENIDVTTLRVLFKILRQLKVSDSKVCNEYWSKVQKTIVSNPSQQESYTLAKYCHRYMHFNNNLNGTYRYIPFEKTVAKLLIDDVNTGISCYIPSKFTKAATFLLAYGHTPRDKWIFPEFILQRIEAMQEQFTIFDCLQLTRGIQIALQMRFKSEMHSELASQIIRLENVFNACTERHLEQPNITLNDLNCIVRSYTNRKSTMKTSIYRNIIEKYEMVPHQPLTSRIIRDITFNANVAKYRIPSLCNALNEYIIQNREFVLGDTVQKVLFCFYNLNYQPENEKIFECATTIINRDFDTMSGLAIVEACLALAFYKEIPGWLIDRVFNISFIQRLEDEIEMCYSKDFYPQRVFNSVMQLNRAVCLDFPENGVPWFQQNYIEAQLSKLPLIKNKFHADVKQALVNFTTDESLLKVNHITPYGYRIDFVLYFDKHKKLVIPPTLNDTVIQLNKVAILLLNSDSFCQNDFQNVRGKEALKERHLEIMGFKVVQINYKQWNSMYMNLPGAKSDYVKDLLS